MTVPVIGSARVPRRRLLALLLAPLAGGCFSVTQRREESLVREARDFNDDLRWARWEAASAIMPQDERVAFLKRVDLVDKELVFADYEVTSITFAPRSEGATVVARFEWFLRGDPRVRDTTVEQRWEHRAGRWQMVEIRRTRGDRIALVTEKVEPPPTEGGP